MPIVQLEIDDELYKMAEKHAKCMSKLGIGEWTVEDSLMHCIESYLKNFILQKREKLI